MYRRIVDDTFSVVDSRRCAEEFLNSLNSLYDIDALTFTMEDEKNGQPPFMDMLVRKEEGICPTAIYRKPTFTGLCTSWDSYCSGTGKKIALMHSLSQRAKKICSPQHFGDEIKRLKVILRTNGYRDQKKYFCGRSTPGSPSAGR